MENNSGRNQQVQNTMHELPHGSNTQKARLKPIYIPIIVAAYFVATKTPHLVPVVWLALILYFGFPKNERKQVIEPKKEIQLIPTYNLTRIDALLMLKDIEKRKQAEAKLNKR